MDDVLKSQCLQRGFVGPDPGQYEGMHAAKRFPHHGKGPVFERPPVEPLFGPEPVDALADIVAAFLGPLRSPKPKPTQTTVQSVQSPHRKRRQSGAGASGASFGGLGLPDGVLPSIPACIECTGRDLLPHTPVFVF